MTVEVIWSPTALREVMRIFDYLMDFNPLAAREVFDALIAAGDGLADLPQRGRLVRNSAMRELVTAYPYIIRYQVAGDAVLILRVRHSARRPTMP